mmetsp:Transcript_3242/g.6508  ORF Transcript_3242/g.6508 Transcript_3242/m.6508 type:complete len:257 (+) Transcript_3242:20-790(+)
MFSSGSEASGSVRGNDAVEAMSYTIQVHFDGALRHSFSVSKALSVQKRGKQIQNQLSELDIDEDSALLDSLKITTTQGGERIPVPDRVKASTVDPLERTAALSSMLSRTAYSEISLWFKTAGGQVTPATCTPKVEPQNIDKPSEKDEEFMRLYAERLADYLGLDNTALSKAVATVLQCCMSIIINDDSKDYSVIEEALYAALSTHHKQTVIDDLNIKRNRNKAMKMQPKKNERNMHQAVSEAQDLSGQTKEMPNSW